MATANDIAEVVRSKFYGFAPQQDADLDMREILYYIYNAVCDFAVQDAQMNAKLDEGYYANDQFFLKYTLTLVPQPDGSLYAPLPVTPAALAGNREIDHVFFPGSKHIAVLVNAKQRGYYNQLRPIKNAILYYLDARGIRVDKNGVAKKLDAITFDMIGPLNSPDDELNLPSNYVPMLIEKTFKHVMESKGITQDTANDKAQN